MQHPHNNSAARGFWRGNSQLRILRLLAFMPIALLASCATRDMVIKEQREQSTRAGQAQQLVRQNTPRPAFLVTENTPRFATRSVPVDPGLDLPAQLGNVTLRLPGRYSLGAIAELLSRLINIPVLVTADALMDPALFEPGSNVAGGAGMTAQGAAGAAAPTPADVQRRAAAMSATSVSSSDVDLRTTYELNYSGPLRGLLDDLATRAGLQWRYNDGRIVLSRVVTRVLTIKSIQGGIKTSATLKAGAGLAGSTSSDGDFWSSLETNLKNHLSPRGKLQMDPKNGVVTVTDSRMNVDAMERFVANQNDLMMRQISLEVEVLQVELSQEQSSGINWSYIGNRLGGLAEITTPNIPGGYSGATPASFGMTNVSSKLLINALEEFGKVNTAYSAVITTTNRQSVPLGVTSNEAYLKSVTAGTVATSTAPATGATLTAGTFTTGFSLMVTPVVLDSSRVLLESALTISALRSLKEFSSGQGDLKNSIQLPLIDDFSTLQRLSVKIGDTLVMTGFEQEILQRNETDLVRGVVPVNQRTKVARQSTVILITPRLGAP
jgi:hypothetical protein